MAICTSVGESSVWEKGDVKHMAFDYEHCKLRQVVSTAKQVYPLKVMDAQWTCIGYTH